MGLEILNPAFGFTWNLAAACLLAVLYVVCEFQTTYIHRNNLYAILEIICMCGLSFPVSYSVTKKKKKQSENMIN